jgi:hypothetical protein
LDYKNPNRWFAPVTRETIVKVTISSRTSSLDDATREDVRDQMFYALSRFGTHIEQVTVRMGGSGGADSSSQQLCRLSVRMKQLGSFSVDAVEVRAIDAVSRAADRAARQAQRILERQREEAH